MIMTADCDNRNGHRIGGIHDIEFVDRQFLHRHSVQKGSRGEDVPMATDGDVLRAKRISEEPFGGKWRKGPIPSRAPFIAGQLRYTGDRYEKNATWPQSGMKLAHGGGHVVDQMQRLSDDRAVESGSREHPGLREIADDCSPRRRVDVEHLARADTVAAEFACVE